MDIKPKAKNLTKGSQAKERLIRTAARRFIKNGYYATGIREIIDEAKVSKGSFYFYFKSKKELAIEAHKYFKTKTLDILWEIAKNSTWEEFVDRLHGWILTSTANQKNYGCPFAVLGTETAFMEPVISELNYASLLEGVQIFIKPLLKSGFSEEEAKVKAERLFSLYEGYMLRYRLSKNLGEIEKLYNALKDI